MKSQGMLSSKRGIWKIPLEEAEAEPAWKDSCSAVVKLTSLPGCSCRWAAIASLYQCMRSWGAGIGERDAIKTGQRESFKTPRDVLPMKKRCSFCFREFPLLPITRHS